MRNTKQEIQSAGLTEIELLEAAFSEELRCESTSHNSDCTLTVVARVKNECPEPSRLWCSERVKQHYFEGEYFACIGCKRKCVDCWKIIPI